ncbi:MAG TPA: DUF1028 domain-containing protein [Thermoplasmataceae archaeon]|nr:DUF1028 domain-containing protein [Thermoplasmatales archaeon AK]HLH86087.1 DUF1028 domain-containing protein [Thermoplasmataceae archaeon]
MTFSVVAFDRDRKEWGVAVASRYLSVGSVVPWAEYGTGCVATQAHVNYSFGPSGLRLLKDHSAADALKILISGDSGRERRQLALVDSRGNAAAHTGKECIYYAGHIVGDGFSVQGNILGGEQVIQSMAKVMENNSEPLEFRLVYALKAAEGSGGDRRGRQSAAILVVSQDREFEVGSKKFIDIHVEDHVNPLDELIRIRNLWLTTFFDREFVPLPSDWAQIEQKVRRLGYPSVEMWAEHNNFDQNIDHGKIGKLTLELLRQI